MTAAEDKVRWTNRIIGDYDRQVTGDTLDGVEVNTGRSANPAVPFDPTNQGPGNKGQVFAIGLAFTFKQIPMIVSVAPAPPSGA